MSEVEVKYPEKLRFTSKYRNYKIFLVSPTTREIEGQLVRKEGKVLEFKDWECITNDPETIKLALSSGYYGKDYTSPEWESIKNKIKTEGEIKNRRCHSSSSPQGTPQKVRLRKRL